MKLRIRTKFLAFPGICVLFAVLLSVAGMEIVRSQARLLERTDKDLAKTNRLTMLSDQLSAMDADRDRCLASGIDAFLTKPIKQGDLAEMLERWVLREPAHTPATPRAPAPATTARSEG